jgi:dinuclear metal center YbgI/SA1388 family protein
MRVPTIKQLSQFLDQFAPTRLAEDWDNVGLLVGDHAAEVERIMTCLTVTPETVAEAIERGVQLVVTHHPLPFQGLKRITTDTIPGRLLWELIRAGVAIYSPHTGFDSATDGINQNLARKFGLNAIEPLKPILNDPESLGAGRIGQIENVKLKALLEHAKSEFSLGHVQYIGDLNQDCRQVAIACGSGGSFLSAAIEKGCDTFVTGEASFHTCLEARARMVSLILLGHYTSERFAVERLATELQATFPALTVWPSQAESDPIQFL